MTQYWVIAPVESQPADLFEKVWDFDLTNGLISIGWHEVGDVSRLTKPELAKKVAEHFPSKPAPTQSLFVNMVWAFYHEMKPGDVILARRGQKVLVAVGTVLEGAKYLPGKNPFLSSESNLHPSYLSVRWHDEPRNVEFPRVVFPMQTVGKYSEAQYKNLFTTSDVEPDSRDRDIVNVVDKHEFVLEKYLEDFIVNNFSAIFPASIQIFTGAEGESGQQFYTPIGIIDILAYDAKAGCFVVIELKKGQPSDQVVGQLLRYMGWVKQHLCSGTQSVKGLVICSKDDIKLQYALQMTQNIDVRYYRVAFSLNKNPG